MSPTLPDDGSHDGGDPAGAPLEQRQRRIQAQRRRHACTNAASLRSPIEVGMEALWPDAVLRDGLPRQDVPSEPETPSPTCQIHHLSSSSPFPSAPIGEAKCCHCRRETVGSIDPISGSLPPPFEESAYCDVCCCTSSTLPLSTGYTRMAGSATNASTNPPPGSHPGCWNLIV